jgi:predicted Fe-S protein YdhL (DUF1289 family)
VIYISGGKLVYTHDCQVCFGESDEICSWCGYTKAEIEHERNQIEEFNKAMEFHRTYNRTMKRLENSINLYKQQNNAPYIEGYVNGLSRALIFLKDELAILENK